MSSRRLAAGSHNNFKRLTADDLQTFEEQEELELRHIRGAWKEAVRDAIEEYEEVLTSYTQDSYLSWDEVYAKEQELISQKLKARESIGWKGTRPSFSVAFSGGGIRAATFQSGVLWQLAEAGVVQDIEYIAAVSGGGYLLSAFASHIVTQESPTSPDEVDSWYKQVVAKTIVRLQRNAGNFVRDCFRLPGVPMDGSGIFPRACDLPFLMMIFFVTICTGPFLFITTVLLPAAELVEIYFGYAMRASFCAPAVFSMMDVLRYESLYVEPAVVLEFFLLSISGTSFFIQKMFAPPTVAPGKEPNRADFRYTIFTTCHRICGALNRLAALLGVVFLVVLAATYVERLNFDLKGWTPLRLGLCARYSCGNGTMPGGDFELNKCDPFEHSAPWYMQEKFRTEFMCNPDGTFALDLPGVSQIRGDVYVMQMLESKHVPRWIDGRLLLVGLSASFLASILLLPFLPSLFPMIVLTCGPLMLLAFVVGTVQFRVFGPLTLQPILGWLQYDQGHWDTLMVVLSAVSCITLPFLGEIKSVWHFYYVRCLRQNFFSHGQDRTMLELRLDPWCPFMLVTGTVNDWGRPIDDSSITEIAFTPLHMGNPEAGYVVTAPTRSLAELTALTGAGCLDALSLSMSDHVRVRFWLQVLNLSWGDYIHFEPSRRPLMRWLLRCVPKRLRRDFSWWFHRSFTMFLLFIMACLFCRGLTMYRLPRFPTEATCMEGRRLMNGATFLGLCLLTLSFFSNFRFLAGLEFAPVLATIQQATGFIHKSWYPPRMLYVTDGGVQDCTAIMQLLQRKCERILLVLAASDPNDELKVLRTTMQAATTEFKMASFYDPQDPRRDPYALLDDFQQNKAAHYFKLGIRYGWRDTESPRFGMLWVVKNRLPEDFLEQQVRPHLSEDEILYGAPSDVSDEENSSDDAEFQKEMEGLVQEDLGGYGCCDCCHTVGNCGRKFPHLSFTGYMWLTPQLTSSLVRLGHDLSAQAILDLLRH